MNHGITLKSPPRFRDVPQFIRHPTYAVDISWDYLKDQIGDDPLDLDPDFKRGHVWDLAKQIAYVEFTLRGGNSAHNIYFNCPRWSRGGRGNYVLVDGKQRITAALAFLDDKVPIFGGHVFSDFTDRLRLSEASFRWHVNDLETRAEVLQWYLDLNTGGVVRTSEEIERVRAMLKVEQGR